MDLSKIEIAMAIFGLLLTLGIFVRQELQLKRLRAISEDTSDTAFALHTDSAKKDMAARLFGLQTKPTEQFRCFFPAHYQRRPLPFVFSGDYHALQVLQSLLHKQIELRPVAATEQSKDDGPGGAASPAATTVKDSNGLQNKWNDDKPGGRIFLCSPQANHALAELAPAVSYGSTEPLEFEGVKLPCWFAKVPPEKKTIWICDRGLSVNLPSPSESDYDFARELEPGKPYRPDNPIHVDLAILLRLTHSGRNNLVLAGIHQYGTWIAGDFLDRLTRDREFHPEITRSDDFLAVIWGEFNSETLLVGKCGIHHEYLWIRKNGEWHRQPVKGSDAI